MFILFCLSKRERTKRKDTGKLRRASRSVASAGASKFAFGSPQLFIRLRSVARFKRGTLALKTGTP